MFQEDVGLQILLKTRAVGANGTLVGFLSRVRANVTIPVRGPVKRLATKGTWVGRASSRMKVGDWMMWMDAARLVVLKKVVVVRRTQGGYSGQDLYLLLLSR